MEGRGLPLGVGSRVSLQWGSKGGLEWVGRGHQKLTGWEFFSLVEVVLIFLCSRDRNPLCSIVWGPIWAKGG